MKKDWIEKQIFEHKEEINDLKAPPSLWQKIEGKLDEKQTTPKVFSIWKYRSIAAIAFGVLSVGMISLYFTNPRLRETVTSSFRPYIDGGIDPSYVTAINMAEDHYSREIKEKIEIAKENNVYNPTVAADIQELDKVYNELKEEMLSKKNVNNKIILNEMMKNYKLRVSLLELLVEKKEESKMTLEEMKKDTI